MEVCGEHGDDIAFALGRYNNGCPACNQIETLNKEHTQSIDALTEEKDDLFGQLTDALEELQDIGEKE